MRGSGGSEAGLSLLHGAYLLCFGFSPVYRQVESSPPNMDITIVIPNLNGASVLPATLAAVAAGSGLLTQEVVRVDNASTDESVA